MLRYLRPGVKRTRGKPRRRNAADEAPRRRSSRRCFESLEPRQLLAGDTTVVFNELMYHPSGGQDLEWIELQNQLAVDVDISGWRLDGGVEFQFPQDTVIPGDGYMVVAADPAALAADGFSGALGPINGHLSNGGEEIELLDVGGRVMDLLDYDDHDPWPVAADGSGASLAKLDPHMAGGAVENWAASFEVGGTPGQENFADPGDPTGTAVRFHEVAADDDPQFFVELANRGQTPIQLDGYLIVTSAGAQFPLETQSLAAGGFVSIAPPELGQSVGPGDRLFLLGPDGVLGGVLDGVVVEESLRARFEDGNPGWFFPDAATPGAANSFTLSDEIVINEIMYHARPQFAGPEVIHESQPLAFDATWQYEQSDVLPGPGWNAVGFDDGGWSSGEGILYAGPFSGQSNPSPIPITTLFSTGISDTGVPIANGQPDPHYVLVESPQSTPPPPAVSATVMANNPAWMANGAESKWIGPVDSGSASVAAGDYVFETTFDLTGFVPESALVSMELSADNSVRVLLNGEETGFTYAGFGAFSPTRTITTGFQGGLNTLTFVLNNAGTDPNPAGLQVKLNGTASKPPAGSELDLGPVTYYFRKSFPFDGNPAITELELASLVDDGAVFYLNGVEIYRQNMPDGQITHATRAAANIVGEGMFGSAVSVPADALREGENILAVEVHQAAGGFADMAFGAELRAIETVSEVSTFAENPEEWIELYNRSDTTIDLSGWTLQGGIEFAFAQNTSLAPGEYLVVAKDAATLKQEYPTLNVAGNFSQRLSNFGDRILLVDQNGNPADEVHYYDGGRWGENADGYGSSLELRDPNTDNAVGEAWGTSVESGKSDWQTVSYRGSAAEAPGSNNPSGFHELIVGLLDAGEILIDDLSVVRDPDGAAVELIQNGQFDTGTDTWRILGNHADHGQTRVMADPDNPGNNVLYLVATGATEHMSNHIETTFANGERTVNGGEYEISFRAKWLSGSNQVHTRLYFNRLAKTTVLYVPSQGGTPGAENSRFETNIGPTYAALRHGPVVPEPSQPVVISVEAADPDGVSSMTLKYSNNGVYYRDVTMVGDADGVYTGTVPGRPAGMAVQFYVEGTDGLGATSTFPADGADSRALYKVQDGKATNGPNHNFRLIMTPIDATFQLTGTNGLSNHRLGATVLFGESEVYYDVDVRVKGSGYSRGGDRTGYNIRFQPDQLFRGVHDVIAVDRTASAYGLGASQREMLVKLIATRAGGIPTMYDDPIYFIPPTTALDASTAQLLMARYDDAFLDSSFGNGGDGTRFKLELIYYPTGTVDGNPESPKIRPNTVLPVDIQNMGDDQEAYRWNHLIKNQRMRDDYSQIMELGKTFSLPGGGNGSEIDLRSQAVMDVDQWLRVFAFESLSGINDTYNQGYAHNLQMFVRSEDNRVVALPWDMDFAFHQSTGMSVFGTGSNLRKIINVPNNLHYFYGHLHDIINTTFNTDYLLDWIYHYAAFAERNVSSTIRSYIDNRRASVENQLPAEVSFRITTNGGRDFSVDEAAVTIEGNGWINVREIRLLGRERPLDVLWTDADSWRVDVQLAPGSNALIFEAFDFQGNRLTSDSINVSSTVTDRPLLEQLRITEINYHPLDPTDAEAAQGYLDDDDFEFIELANIGTEPIDLTGVAFTEGIQFVFAEGENQLGAGERVVLVRNSDAFEARYGSQIDVAGQYGGRLDNGGERITISDRLGFPILDFRYDDDGRWPSRPDGRGASLLPNDLTTLPLTEPQRTTYLEDGRNWQSGTLYGGSPGRPDDGPLGVVVNEVLTHTDPPLLDTIELLNTADHSIDIGGWYLSDSWGWAADPDNGDYKKFRIPTATVLEPGQYVVFDEDDFNLSRGVDPDNHPGDFALSGAHGDDVWLMAADASGNLTHFADHVDFPAAAAGESLGRWPDGSGELYPMWSVTLAARNSGPRVGPVIISEVMYNPQGTLGADDLEFVEIFNSSATPVDLTNWRIRGGIDFDFPTGAVLGGNAALVVVPFDTNDAGRLDAFRSYYEINALVPVVGGYEGVLDNGGERIHLWRPDTPPAGEPNFLPRLLEDEVRYFAVAPWPTEPDGSGESLHRDGARLWGNDAASWTSALPSPGSVDMGLNDDAYEPNDTLAEAYFPGGGWDGVALSSLAGAGVQTDEDWYRIEVAPGNRYLTVDLTFVHARGDLDLALYNPAGTQLAIAQSETDDEQLDVVLNATGTLYLRIDGAGWGNAYDLWWHAQYVHPGDADLNGVTDLSDFNIWNGNKFIQGTDWHRADFNGDGNTDLSDFNMWNAYKFTSAPAATPPDAILPKYAPWMADDLEAIVDGLVWLRQQDRSDADQKPPTPSEVAVDRLLATYWP